MPYPIFQLIDPTAEATKLRRNTIIVSTATIINKAIWSYLPPTIQSIDHIPSTQSLFMIYRYNAPEIISGTLSLAIILLVANYAVVAFEDIVKFRKKKKQMLILRINSARDEKLNEYERDNFPQDYDPYQLDPEPDEIINWQYQQKVNQIVKGIEKEFHMVSSTKDFRLLFNACYPLLLATYALVISYKNIFILIGKSW